MYSNRNLHSKKQQTPNYDINMFRLIVICGCFMALANGGIIGGGLIGATGPAAIALQPSGAAAIALHPGAVGVPSLTSSSSNIIRGIGNLGAISATSNTVDTAFSSERNSDVRINNPGLQTGILSYAATAPALAGHVGVATAPALTLANPTLAASAVGLGLNGVAVNGYGLGVNGYGLGVNGYGVGLNGHGLGLNGHGLGVHGYGVGVNGYGLQSVNGLGLGLGAVSVL